MQSEVCRHDGVSFRVRLMDWECENGLTYWREGTILKDYRTSFPCNAVLVGFPLSVSAEQTLNEFANLS